MILKIGILNSNKINVHLFGIYIDESNNQYSGDYSFESPICLSPVNNECKFKLLNVTIGVNFHWQRREDQIFDGKLEIIKNEEGSYTAVNHINLEEYLKSVISSEMASTSMLELLKAHAIISRSWAIRQIQNKNIINKESFCTNNHTRRIVWYSNESHKLFDLCADDHCQRYQGIGKAINANATLAVEQTKDEVLLYNDQICDARFYKSCGGVTEEYNTCWENKKYPYLTKVYDGEDCNIDLTTEEGAEKWIMSYPKSYCNTQDSKILQQVLNDYDQETHNFFRWKVEYTTDELSELINKRSGINFGTIKDLIAEKRGVSGRIEILKIIGTEKTLSVGKELEIRKWLSNSHLYSSAFIVKKETNKFILHGAGWGHGVGLCQIGAAVMAANGCNYKEILSHYYPGSTIGKYKQDAK